MRSFVREFRQSLKRPESEEWVDLVLYRPFGFLLVRAIYRTNITPNQLSLVAMALGVFAGIGFGFGRAGLLPVAAFLLFASIVVDCSDGQLARLKGTGTPLGRLIDGVSDYVVGLAVYAGLGIGFGRDPKSAALWWFLIAATAASNAFHSMVFDYYRNRYLDVVKERNPSDEDELDDLRTELRLLTREKRSATRRLFLRIYISYTLLQRRVTIKTEGWRGVLAKASAEQQRKNRIALRLWSFLGSSTQGTILIAAALAGRLDLYFWGIIVVRNLLAVVMFVVQGRIDRSLTESAVC